MLKLYSIIRAHGLPEEFPKKVLDEAELCSCGQEPQEEIDRRLDLRDLRYYSQ